jgi:putative membrane protein
MVGQNDRRFMMETAQSNMAEIKVAQIAQEKASSDEVKQYARKLVDDHTKAGEELKRIAAQKNVQLPTDMGKHQHMISKVENMSGDSFDRNFMKMQVQHHKKDVSNFQKQVNRSMDSDVKTFASTTLPTLQEHLQQAQTLASNTGTRSRSADRSDETGASGRTDTSGTSGSSTPNQSGTGSTQSPANQNNPTPTPQR